MSREDSFNKYDREGAYHYRLMESDPFYGAKIKKALSHVEAEMVVCDIGCGDGVFLKFAKNIGAKVYGVDTSLEGIRLAKIHSGCGNLCIGSVSNLPFLSSSINLVMMIDVVNYLYDYVGAVQEVLRVLKPGGNLVIMSPHIVDLEKEKETTPDSWQKHACSAEELQAIVERDMKVTEVAFIQRPVLTAISQFFVMVLRFSGLLSPLKALFRYGRRPAAISGNTVAIERTNQSHDICLNYHKIPEIFIKKYEPLEFIIVAQKYF